jgi:hypothetical protein
MNRIADLFFQLRGEWRKLHSEELHILFSSRNIIRQIISRRMRWVGHVALMREERKVYRVLWERPKERGHLGDPRRRWDYSGS